MLPVLPLLLALVVRRPPARLGVFQPDGRPRVLIALVVFALLLIAALGKSDVTTRENSGRRAAALLDAAEFVLAAHRRDARAGVCRHRRHVPARRAAAEAGRASRRIRDLPFGWLLAGSIGASLFALHLVYVQLNDTYLVGLLPFALLIPARALAIHGRPPRSLAACAALSVAMLVALSLWMRGNYNWQEAAMARCRPAAGGRHHLALHRREPALDRVPRRLRRVAGARPTRASTTPSARPRRQRRVLSTSPSMPGFTSAYWSGTHQVAVSGDVRARERLASGSDRAVPQRTFQSPRRRRLRTHRMRQQRSSAANRRAEFRGEPRRAGRTTSAPPARATAPRCRAVVRQRRGGVP